MGRFYNSKTWIPTPAGFVTLGDRRRPANGDRAGESPRHTGGLQGGDQPGGGAGGGAASLPRPPRPGASRGAGGSAPRGGLAGLATASWQRRHREPVAVLGPRVPMRSLRSEQLAPQAAMRSPSE
ncbi:translation initiation factor IF-2-like [Choloepus didactylus]|uniref:translation initiation factor IF-2-like n=1 Tax=Choloepus didactylus TaxID=27675 RepID=UPI00189F1ACD|nr:translation initiation factor IF-2-like [Choloepus didactylus]